MFRYLLILLIGCAIGGDVLSVMGVDHPKTPVPDPNEKDNDPGQPVPLPPEPTPVPYTEPYEPAPTPIPCDPPSEWDHIPEYEPNGWKWEYGDWSPNPWCN